MSVKPKFLAAAICALALTASSVAFASGLTIKTSPTHPKRHQLVTMRVSGLKPGERVKAVLTIPSTGQKNTYFPTRRASTGGIVINTVKAEIKGRNVWTYTGRRSHRKGSTTFVVK